MRSLLFAFLGFVGGATVGSGLPVWASLSPLTFGAGMAGLIVGLSVMMWIGINH